MYVLEVSIFEITDFLITLFKPLRRNNKIATKTLGPPSSKTFCDFMRVIAVLVGRFSFTKKYKLIKSQEGGM